MSDTLVRTEIDPNALLEGLNDDQILAVTTTEGPVLVVAGPGSGKTRVLTHRIAWLLAHDVSAHEILAVTFTNKAAREMKDRISAIVGPGRADGLEMGTFHSFGVKVLRQNPGLVGDKLGLLPNFTIYDTAEQLELTKRAVQQVGLDPKVIQPRSMLSRISKSKSQLLAPADVAEDMQTYDDEILVRVYREYEKQLRTANAVDFDDLLGLPIRLFDEHPPILERYQHRFRYIMVDEYQDTNRVQYVLVSALAEHHRNLFVVGDPDQSIYGWRQADIKNILDFSHDYPDLTQIHLEINYRSTQHIVQAADRVIRDNTQRIERSIRTLNDEGEKIQIRELTDQQHEAQFIVAETRRLISSSNVKPADVAVLYRTTAQSRAIEEEFRNSEIGYRIIGGLRFYERKEVKDAIAMLRLLGNPADQLSLERAINNLPIGKGIGPRALASLYDWAALNNRPVVDAVVAMAPGEPFAAESIPPPVLSGAAASAAQKLGAIIAHLRGMVGKAPLSELFDEMIQETRFREQFRENSEEEMERWTNIVELRSDIARYDDVVPDQALSTYLEQVALVSDVDSLPEDTTGKVTLITLHSAKGLEFPVVFIAGVEEGLLPLARSLEEEATGNHQPLEEERRLFYVGITRARVLLYITYASSRVSYGRYQAGAASRFLEALPAESVKSVTRRDRVSTSYDSGRWDQRSGRLASAVTSSWLSSSDIPKKAEPVELPEYAAGMKVFHAKFGEGVIDEVVESRSDKELGVTFARHGKKRLLASLAKLDIL